jgi:hypothetical protein
MASAPNIERNPHYATSVLAIKRVGICEHRICRLPDTATEALLSAAASSDQPIAEIPQSWHFPAIAIRPDKLIAAMFLTQTGIRIA